MIQVDKYFSNGLKPPTSSPFQKFVIQPSLLLNGALFSGCWNWDRKLPSCACVQWLLLDFCSCRLGMFRPRASWEHGRWIIWIKIVTWQIVPQNKHLEIISLLPVKTESLPERWGVVPPMPSCHPNKTTNKFNIYQTSIPIYLRHPTNDQIHGFLLQGMVLATQVLHVAGWTASWFRSQMKGDVKSDRWKKSSLIVVMKGTGFWSLFGWFFLALPKERGYSLRVFGGLCCLRVGVHPDLRSLKYIMDRQKSTQELEQYDMFSSDSQVWNSQHWCPYAESISFDW